MTLGVAENDSLALVGCDSDHGPFAGLDRDNAVWSMDDAWALPTSVTAAVVLPRVVHRIDIHDSTRFALANAKITGQCIKCLEGGKEVLLCSSCDGSECGLRWAA